MESGDQRSAVKRLEDLVKTLSDPASYNKQYAASLLSEVRNALPSILESLRGTEVREPDAREALEDGLINGTYPREIEYYQREARNIAAVWSNGSDGARVCILAAILRAALRQPAAPGGEPRELIALRENLREAWAAFAMIRETVETLAPSGTVKGAEYLDGPTFTHEADALVEGILAIQSSPPPSDEHAKVIEALKPFVDFASASGFKYLPDKFVLTSGSGMAVRQLTAADFRKLLTVFPTDAAAAEKGR